MTKSYKVVEGHALKGQSVDVERATPYAHAVPLAESNRLWRDGICSCTADWCSCVAVCCCSPITVAQLFMRFSYSGGANRTLVFVLLVLFLWVGLGYSNSAGSSPTVKTPQHGPPHPAPLTPMQQILTAWSAIAGLLSCLIVMSVRSKIRARDAIAEEHCGGCEDCCCSFWCNPCAQCQIMRHAGLTQGKYDLFSPTGSETIAV